MKNKIEMFDENDSDYIDIDDIDEERYISCGSAAFLLLCAVSTFVCLMWH